jgi:hypothetical protein
VNFCHNCGYRLPLVDERFCPNCGTDFQQNVVEAESGKDGKNSSIGIHETKGDVFGAGLSGSGNIIGKEV